MFKNIFSVVIGVALILALSMCLHQQEAAKAEPYKQNQMVNGCVMQKTGDIWVKTCG